MEQVKMMTVEKNLVTLGKKVKKQIEKMNKEFMEMRELLENNASFSQRLEKSNLMSYIKQAQGIIMPKDK